MEPSTLDKKLDSIKFFKLVIQVPFACHSESIFWQKHLLLKFTGRFKCSCEMNSLSCPSESNNKHGRLREGYMGEQCWTLLQMGTHQPAESHNIHLRSTRQLDNGEDRLMGKQDSWREQTRAGWMTSPNASTLFTREWRGWI